MGKIIEKIKTNTAGMNRQEKLEYIKTYYWYHILGICAAVGLVVFLVVHFGFADRTPEFSCAIINQKIDYDRDKKLASALQKQFADQQINVIVDSDGQTVNCRRCLQQRIFCGIVWNPVEVSIR